MQDKATEVVSLVMGIRRLMPRIGTRKLYHLLEEPLSALGVGRDKLFDVLRANHMLIVPKRQYRQTTNSKHMFHKHKNLVLDRIPTRPEEIWVSDITYVGARNKHTYLALVTDAYSKKIVGYDLSDSLSAEGTVRALQMVCRGRLIGVARNEAEGRSHKNTIFFFVSRFFVHYSGSAGRKASDIKTVVVGPLLKPQTTTT